MSEFNVCHFETLRGEKHLSFLNIPHTTKVGSVWSYATFRQLLLKFGTDKKGSRLTDVPSSIELNASWHETLNQMRRQHVDGLERFSPVIYNPRKRSIHILNMVATGDNGQVSAETQNEVMEKALKQGMTKTIGFKHSHTTMYDFVVLHTYPGPTFSPTDIYLAVVKRQSMNVELLADDHTNQLLLRTADTKKVAIDNNKVPQEKYVKNITQLYSPLYNGNVELSEQGFREADEGNWQIAIAQCRKYKLALYRGLPNQPLTRVYP